MSCDLTSLQAFLDENRDQPVDYVNHDCVRWAAMGWAGVPLDGAWSGLVGAMRYIKAQGASRVADVIDCHLPVTDTPKRGDLVALDTAPLDTMGICLGRESVFLTDNGYVRMPTRHTFRAWSVS
jgi:hypothetical protein